MARNLARFSVAPGDGEDFQLRIEDDDGETIEMTASYEQLDLIVEAIDAQLDEVVDEVEEVDELGANEAELVETDDDA